MGAGLRGVAVLEAVVVVVLDRVLVLVQGEGPEAVEVDAVAEASGQGVHEEAGGGSLDVHLVGQPVPAKRQKRKACYCPRGCARTRSSSLVLFSPFPASSGDILVIQSERFLTSRRVLHAKKASLGNAS